MPWLVSMRIIGSVIGAFATVATRRSVIFSSEGLEFVFTFCGTASRVSSAQKPAPANPASPFKKPRRPAARIQPAMEFLLFESLPVEALRGDYTPWATAPDARSLLPAPRSIVVNITVGIPPFDDKFFHNRA